MGVVCQVVQPSQHTYLCVLYLVYLLQIANTSMLQQLIRSIGVSRVVLLFQHHSMAEQINIQLVMNAIVHC